MSELINANQKFSIKKIDKETIVINIYDNDILASIIGEFNENLKKLEKLTSTSIFYRGNTITVKGKLINIEKVSDAIRFLVDKFLLTQVIEKNDITNNSKTEIDKNVSSVSNKSLESREREERLREISKKLRTPSGLTYLEEQPAYKRNNVTLEDVPKSDKEDTTNFTLEQNGEDITLKKNNSFLHDNVD